MQKKSHYLVACSIAGSDSGGGAGIQADLKTFSALGVFGTTIITAITAQNTLGVTGIQPVCPEILKKQITAVFDDLQPKSVKIGMLHNSETVQIVAECLKYYRPQYVVLDPVMIAESGALLIENETINIIKKELFKRATIITPNIPEAEAILQIKINSRDDMLHGVKQLINEGASAVLLKGGHLEGDEKTDCLMIREQSPIFFTHPAIHTKNTHGTGCTLSSAIAAHLAMGEDLHLAVKKSIDYLQQALSFGAEITIGKGNGTVNHFFDPKPLKIINS
jgi:hydroxymethylpyrimidine/phosphomethylpyrimidine kinase